jgi:hypothetical protein
MSDFAEIRNPDGTVTVVYTRPPAKAAELGTMPPSAATLDMLAWIMRDDDPGWRSSPCRGVA